MRTPYSGREPNLVRLDDPVTLVGDIHGQFYDLLKLLEIGGSPDRTKFIFLGDYVDRGSYSIEVVLLLYAIKVCYPDTVILLRGNHECRQMTTFFNFRNECMVKYDIEVYDCFMESFDCMPLAAILNNKFLIVHGGISPELKTLDDLDRITRFVEPPRTGIYCDLLWSDPVDSENGAAVDAYRSNEVRGCSYFYGLAAVSTFLRKNSLLSVIRAHEAQLDGYKMHRWNGTLEFPVVITLFSAPNYCDIYNNKGAIIKFENNILNIQQFNYTAHPYILPNFLDIFSWSMPFVIEKVLGMLHYILKPRAADLQPQRVGEQVRDFYDAEKKARIEVLKNKVRSVSRMMKIYRCLREDSELIMQLKGLCPGNRIPRGLIIEGREALSSAVEAFEKAKHWDTVNERMPDQ
jgi:serine/threonine-protein phosphatase 2B catalytic subunit